MRQSSSASPDLIPLRRRLRLPPGLRVVAFLCCAGAALLVRRLVAAEQIGDEAALVAAGAIVAALVFGAGAAVRGCILHRRKPGRIAGAGLALAYLALLAVFLDASLVDASVEMEALVEAQNPADPPAAIVLGPTGTDVRLSGELQEGTARRLEALLADHPGVTRIHLTSEGGLADEGQALGTVIAAHHLTTFVPDYCVSACTLAFVRGHDRLVLDDSRIGFHAPYQQGLFGTMYRGDASEQRAGYRAAGLSGSFVDAALKVDPASVWYPTAPELKSAGVITGVIDRYRLPDSELDGAADLHGARELILRNYPLMAAVETQAPHALDKVAAWYLERYRSGRSEGENADALKAIVKATVAFGLARADDPTLAAVARLIDRALERADTSDTCTALAGTADLTLAARLLDDEDGALDAAEPLFAAALSGHHVLAGPNPVARVLQLAATDATAKAGAADCEAPRAWMADLVGRGDAAIAPVMRAIVDANAQQYRSALHALLSNAR